MTTTAATAHADQLHATVRDARDCDALDPCASCQAKTAVVVAARHAARINALPATPVVPQPRSTGMLRQRLAQFAL